MFRSRLIALTVAFVLALSAVATLASADVDPQIAEIIEGIKAGMEEMTPTYADLDVEIKANGQVAEKFVQEMWVKDLSTMRVERSDGTVILRTPDEFLIFEGRSKIMLHMPKETIDALGDEADEAFDAAGLPSSLEKALEPFVKGAEHMTVVGEVVISESECWIIDVGEDAFEHFKSVLVGFPPGFEIESVQISIDKELYASRSTKIGLKGPAAVEINSMTWTIEEDIEIEDELLAFEPPEDTTTITWTPEDDPEEIMERFRNAARNEIIRQMQEQG
ncbi:MAG TPA: hypothetical protein QGH10_26380 [Armatimonadota bacterium]|nr:hypothetical protein [Armatimonadota bacterium]